MRRLRRSRVELTGERRRWACSPWRRVVVVSWVREPFALRGWTVNQNLITQKNKTDSARFGSVSSALASGHAVAYALAAQGLCGELRLADFDDIDLSNLNRVPAGVFDLGVNKATVAARRIAELDAYQPVRV